MCFCLLHSSETFDRATMVYCTIVSLNNIFVPFSHWRSSNLSSSHSNSLIQFYDDKKRKKKKKKSKECFVPLAAASSASFSYPPINLEYLQREFSGHGATFEDIGETCIAKLTLENGSSATVVLSRGMVTSYKVPVWHGGNVELLHTWVSEEETEEDDEVVIQGGVSSAVFSDQGHSEMGSWSMSSDWVLQDITGDSKDYVQVKLGRRDTNNMLEMKQIITLREETLSCDLIVSNTNLSAIQIKCSLLSHLTVSTPEATYAVGLEGSNYVETTPFLPRPETILEEEEEEENKPKIGEMEFEEGSNYKQLREEMSRIYTCAPQSFTVIDRGRRNSVVVGREGFEEVYMFSPGSRNDSFSKYAYVCVAQSALLNPITLNPGCVWRGVQHLHNPNL